MAVIGATQLEPVNVLGQYVQGMELGRAATAQRQQEAEKAQLQNYLASADLSSPEVQNALLRMPGGAQIAQQAAQLGASRAAAERSQYEMARGKLTDLYNVVSAAKDPTSYARARAIAAQMGLDLTQIPEEYDPAFVEQAKNSVLTAAQRLDAEQRGRTADIQERQVDVAERQVAIKERELTEGAGEAGMVKPPALQKGERWNPEAQRVEAVEGSDIYVKQSGKHGKDYSAFNAINTQRDLANSKIDKLLSEDNKDAFSNLFGGYTAFVTRELSGKTASVRSELESLKNNLKAAGKKIISSAGPGAIGQITEREWPILEGMIAELRTTMEVDDARAKLQEIKTFMDNLTEMAGDEYETTWGRTQYYKQPKGGSTAAPESSDILSEADAILGL